MLLRLSKKVCLEDIKKLKTKWKTDLYLVGEERNKLLLAQDDQHSTHLYSYDLASEKLIKIYNHNAPCRCVAASMDSNESILAITTLETREKDGVSQDYFKSSLAEILPSGESYRLNVRSQLVQRVQFINSKTTLFLFMIEGMFIRLYQMHSRKRMAGGVKIVAQPVLLSEITKKFKWYDWCSRTQRLFVLSSGMLRCYSFPKKEKLVFEIPFNDSTPIPKDFIGFRHNKFEGRATLQSRQMRTLVTLPDNGLCMCIQGEPKDKKVPVSVYILHHNVKVSFELPGVSLATFCSVGQGLLLCWMPGVCSVLLDCGLGSPPTPSLSVQGAFATPLPQQDDRCWMAPVQWSHNAVGWFGANVTLFHSDSGTLYSLEIDRAALLDMFSLSNPSLHLQALNLAVKHMNDSELYTHLMMHALSRKDGVAASTELLGEFFASTLHSKLSMDERVPPYLPSFLPQTRQPSLLDERYCDFAVLKDSRSSNPFSMRVSTLLGYLPSLVKGELLLVPESELPSDTLNSNTSFERHAHPLTRSLSYTSPASNRTASPNTAHTPETAPSSGVSRLVQMLFGRDDNDSLNMSALGEGEGPEGAECVSVCRLWGHAYEETLADSLYRYFAPEKESKSKCLKYAKIIRKYQIEQVNLMYKLINDAMMLLKNDFATFRVLENFYCLLEQESVPLPSGFSSLFASLGYKCLPTRLFLRYIELNIFFLTDEFISNLLRQNPKMNSELKLLLILRIRDMNLLVRILYEDPIHGGLAVQHFIGLCGIVLPESHHDIDLLENSDNSFFIPLSVFQAHVRVRTQGSSVITDDETIAAVYACVCKSIKKALNYE